MRNVHAVALIALAKCVAPHAAAEEPRATPSEAEAAAPATEAAAATPPVSVPSGNEVSEAGTSEPQVAEVTKFDAPPVSAPVPASPPPPVKDKPPASKERLLLGIRLPTFIALSVGGLGAGGAVATRIAAANWPSADPKINCVGHCTDAAHSLETTSTILAGIAVAAVGTGLVLALSDPGSARKRLAMTPVLGMSVSTNKAAASASWRF